jgi:4-hydroxyphenylpyruvate dioxygenase-like putative hemolysin
VNDVDLLAEIRAWRDEFARSHGYDLEAIAAAIRDADRAVATRLVHGEPRRPAVHSPPNQTLQPTRPATAATGT